MENNFIQQAALAGYAVAYTIDPIFKHIIDCVQLLKPNVANILLNSFIQMAASDDHAVAYTIGPIFKHIIDSVQLYFTNSFTKSGLSA